MKHKLSFWNMALLAAMAWVGGQMVGEVNQRIEFMEMTSATPSSEFMFDLATDGLIVIFMFVVSMAKLIEWFIFPLANWLYEKFTGARV